MKPDITLVFPRSTFLIDEAVFPPLGILYLSAHLKKQGFDVQCLDFGIGHTIDMIESDTVGISFTTPQRFEAFKLAKELNQVHGKTVIAGGPHPTHLPQECLRYGFTHVLRGYGEQHLAKFFGKWVKEPDIDDIPFPDRDALPLEAYHYYIDDKPATPVMTSRGCPFRCSYCGRIDSTFSMQSSERTIRELRHIDRNYGYDAFMIYDDVFIASKRRLKEMVDVIGGDYTFRCFARSNLLDDDTCELMKRLGVVEVGIGIESGSTDILKKNMKGTTREHNLRAVENLHKHGIRAKAFLIIGLPGETVDTIVETADWIEEAKPDDVDFSVLQPMPGSRIFSDPVKWGISFSYNGNPGWYKGKPGEYTGVSTHDLSAEEIVAWRDLLEEEYKPKELLR